MTSMAYFMVLVLWKRLFVVLFPMDPVTLSDDDWGV